MTGEQRVAAGGFPMAGWVFMGIFIVAFWGLVAYTGQDNAAAGLMVAGTASLLVLASLALWHRAQSKHAVPAAEYLAVAWLLAYFTLWTVDAIADGELPSADWLFFLPPLSFVPLMLRVLIGDDGTPRGAARSAAYYSHQVIGVLFCAVGLVLIVSVLFLIAAPIPLVPGIMHLRAGHLYKLRRRNRPEPDPQRGFMDSRR